MGGGCGREWIHVYTGLSPFVVHWNYHNIVNQPYSIFKKYRCSWECEVWEAGRKRRKRQMGILEKGLRDEKGWVNVEARKDCPMYAKYGKQLGAWHRKNLVLEEKTITYDLVSFGRKFPLLGPKGSHQEFQVGSRMIIRQSFSASYSISYSIRALFCRPS